MSLPFAQVGDAVDFFPERANLRAVAGDLGGRDVFQHRLDREERRRRRSVGLHGQPRIDRPTRRRQPLRGRRLGQQVVALEVSQDRREPGEGGRIAEFRRRLDGAAEDVRRRDPSSGPLEDPFPLRHGEGQVGEEGGVLLLPGVGEEFHVDVTIERRILRQRRHVDGGRGAFLGGERGDRAAPCREQGDA